MTATSAYIQSDMEGARLARPSMVAFSLVAATSVGFALCIILRLGGNFVSSSIDDLGEFLAAFMAGTACLLRAPRAGDSKRAWLLLSASSLAWAAGQAIWSYYDIIGSGTSEPSIADCGFLLALPLEAAGVLFLTSYIDRLALKRFARMAFGIAAVSMLAWATVAVDVSHRHLEHALGTIIEVAYPLGDLLVLTVGLLALSRTVINRASLYTVVVGVMAFTAADTSFAYLNATGNYGLGSWLDTGWVTGYLLIAVAAAGAGTPGGRSLCPRRMKPPKISRVDPWRTCLLSRISAQRVINSIGIVLILADTSITLYDLALMLRMLT